jgi:hypothetical protein
VPAISFAVVYIGLGEKGQAFTWLEKAYAERNNFLAFLKCSRTSGLFAPIRALPI